MPAWRMSASRALFIGVLLAALLLPAEAASAATRTYTVSAKDVYVRNKRSGYTIGTLRAGQTIDVQRVSNLGKGRRWGYGLVHGEFGSWRGRRCGWVYLSGSFTAGAKAKRGCPLHHNNLPESKIFKHGSYIAHAGTGAVKPVNVVPCPDSRAFGNYDPAGHGFFTPYTSIPAGQGPERPGFGLRYVTKDGSAAMLKDSGLAGAPPWFFMSTACIERLPVYIGDDQRQHEMSFHYAFGDATVKPSSLDTFKDLAVLSIRWERWGSRTPVGSGTARVNSCNPICAAGKIYRKRGVKIQLSDARVGDCRGVRSFLYTRATVSWPQIGKKGRILKKHVSGFALGTDCGGAGKTRFSDTVDLGFTTADVSITAVRCSTALRVLRHMRRHHTRHGLGWTCKSRLVKPATDIFTCRKGKARIEEVFGD